MDKNQRIYSGKKYQRQLAQLPNDGWALKFWTPNKSWKWTKWYSRNLSQLILLTWRWQPSEPPPTLAHTAQPWSSSGESTRRKRSILSKVNVTRSGFWILTRSDLTQKSQITKGGGAWRRTYHPSMQPTLLLDCCCCGGGAPYCGGGYPCWGG